MKVAAGIPLVTARAGSGAAPYTGLTACERTANVANLVTATNPKSSKPLARKQ
jgi:hypothetical protein